MVAAATHLCGHYDFSAFRSSECQSNSPIRRVERLTVERQGEWVVVEVTANAFLHHMMRNIAGLLIGIGRAEAPVSWAKEILEGRDREVTGRAARTVLAELREKIARFAAGKCSEEERDQMKKLLREKSDLIPVLVAEMRALRQSDQ